MKNNKILIVTIKPWNINNAFEFQQKYKNQYDVNIITSKEEFEIEKIVEFKPRYIFFPHWSWIIPQEIYSNFESIVFHMTDLPYGRGGSPLQNLILNKVYNTKISAIQVDEGLDTGKIYLKENFYIGVGSAEEIFHKMSEIIFFKMIPEILENKLIPYKQEGEPVIFKRRNPEESNIFSANFQSVDSFYDFVRMLDADGYPKAFFKIGVFKVFLSDIHKKSGKLEGKFEIIKE